MKTLDFQLKDMPLWSMSLNLNKKFMKDQAALAENDDDFCEYLTYLDTPLPLAQQAVLKEYQDLEKLVKDLDREGRD
jgi:hypothetical protein